MENITTFGITLKVMAQSLFVINYINWDVFKLKFVGLIKDVEYVKLAKYETCDEMNVG